MKKTFLLIFLSTLFLLTGCTKQVETIKTKIETTDEAKHYIVVTAYDKDSEEVWNYKSNEVYVGQADNIEYYGEKDNKLYLNINGIITILSKQTGKLIAENSNYKGSGSQYIFDDNNNLYLSSWLEPCLFVIDKNGNTLNKVTTYNNDLLSWPDTMSIQDNVLTVYYPGYISNEEVTYETSYELDDLLNNKVTKKINVLNKYAFENTEYFRLEDGIVYAKYNDSEIIVLRNIKNIYAVPYGNSGEGVLILIQDNGDVLFINGFEFTETPVVRKLSLKNIKYLIYTKFYNGINFAFMDTDGFVHTDFSEV